MGLDQLEGSIRHAKLRFDAHVLLLPVGAKAHRGCSDELDVIQVVALLAILEQLLHMLANHFHAGDRRLKVHHIVGLDPRFLGLLVGALPRSLGIRLLAGALGRRCASFAGTLCRGLGLCRCLAAGFLDSNLLWGSSQRHLGG